MLDWRNCLTNSKIISLDGTLCEVLEIWSNRIVLKVNDKKMCVDDSNCSEFREV